MTCDGLPDPGSLSDLNTFLHVATKENENASLDTITEKCEVITNVRYALEHDRACRTFTRKSNWSRKTEAFDGLFQLISKVERISRSIGETCKAYAREYESVSRRFTDRAEREP